ncbi:hypothetical protein [Psychroflexus planctonicus]|uniref:Fibronectin type-III domain-containing protein n=1 Tax=Psychroflexus planctonicus TaxID=1526575 RepID=A0ABQ1SMR2_9FLAO|nr:hypothetical protein [Psychroflexus planctonicus]GGE42478.1 hypothetical protein GCM10010832_23030 [Psychroflexus planctonicus]
MKYLKLLLILVILLSISCSDDENNLINLDNSFEINVQNIGATSADIIWELNEENMLDDTYFSLYVNESLVDDQISIKEYYLENLSPSTEYNIRLEFKNINNNLVSISDSFTTQSNGKFLLTKYFFGDTMINLKYNENENLTEKLLETNHYHGTGYVYYYNSNGNLRTVMNASGYYGSAQISYSPNGLFDNIIWRNGFDVYYKYGYDNFTSNSYTLTNKHINEFLGEEILQFEKNVEYTLDYEGRLTSTIYTNVNTQETNSIYFDYSESGNLIEISYDDNILNIEYDQKNNFHTYNPFLAENANVSHLVDVGGLLYLDEPLREILKFLPNLKYINKNNPVKYTLNGTETKTFEYDYNDMNYPTSIIVKEGDEILLNIGLEYIPSQLN